MNVLYPLIGIIEVTIFNTMKSTQGCLVRCVTYIHNTSVN